MIVTFHMLVLIFDELCTTPWQKEVRDIAREVVEALAAAKDTGSAV